jgi:hypothetical protein
MDSKQEEARSIALQEKWFRLVRYSEGMKIAQHV